MVTVEQGIGSQPPRNKFLDKSGQKKKYGKPNEAGGA